jgi:putative tryptophan/tyrosine transport system substrate-binding protein
MRRRDFIKVIAGLAADWPLAARAQQPERIRRIGVLMNVASNDAEGQVRNAAFVQGLQEGGWAVGRNIEIEYRWGAGDTDRIRQYATELIALAPDVILAAGTSTVAPLFRLNRSLPIVFVVVPDPVGAGFVESLARPGGNATGFSDYEYGIGAKWLELLPHATNFPRFTISGALLPMTAWFPMGQIFPTNFAVRPATLTAFSRARSLLIFRSKRQQSICCRSI